MASGDVTFTFTSGMKVATTGTYDSTDNHLDTNKGGRGYPTRLDFKNGLVGSISFKPDPTGKTLTWTSWKYFNNGQWAVDRFTELA